MTLDLVLVLALALSVYAGLRVGLLVRAAGLGGVVLGIGLSTATVPFVVGLAEPATVSGTLVVTGLTVALTVLVAMIVLQVGAFRFRTRLAEDAALSAVDRVGGAVVGVAGVLVFVWVTTPIAALVPGTVSAQVRDSVVVSLVEDLAPDAPDALLALESFLASTRFPEVFSDVAPARTTVDPPADVPVPASVVTSGAASTVRVEAAACGSLFSGTGWTAEPDHVVTNAHVVLGADAVSLVAPGGTRLAAEVVVLDVARDLALLRATGLGLAPLPRGVAEANEPAVSLGHPLGQDELRVAPARVDRTVRATGRDVYGEGRVSRRVVVLAATLATGDSGSPVLDADGTVVATVFAVNPGDPSTAYALADEEVAALLAAPRGPVGAGRCP